MNGKTTLRTLFGHGIVSSLNDFRSASIVYLYGFIRVMVGTLPKHFLLLFLLIVLNDRQSLSKRRSGFTLLIGRFYFLWLYWVSHLWMTMSHRFVWCVPSIISISPIRKWQVVLIKMGTWMNVNFLKELGIHLGRGCRLSLILLVKCHLSGISNLRFSLSRHFPEKLSLYQVFILNHSFLFKWHGYI